MSEPEAKILTKLIFNSLDALKYVLLICESEKNI